MPGSEPIGTDVEYAASCLRAGRLVGIPTETVYGLATNGLDADAVLEIFRAKQRPSFDPLILHVAGLEQALPLVKEIPDLARELARRFWPGPLTLLLEKTAVVPDLVTSGLPRVALRVPAHPLSLRLLQALDFPLAAPSANPFGYVSPTTAAHVAAQLGNETAYILDGGECAVGIESTIVGFESGKPVIFRLGGLPLETLEAVTGPLPLNTAAGASPVAPGMIKSHYAPRHVLQLADIGEAVEQAGERGELQELGVLAYRKDWSVAGVGASYCLSPAGRIEEAAHNLFAGLRLLDQAPVSRIVAEPVPDTGLGRAINDRLRRAAASRK